MCKRFSVIFVAIFLVWFLLLGVNRTFAQEPEENIPEEEVQQEEAQPAEAPQPEQPEQPVEQPQQQVEQPAQPEAPPPPPPPPVAKPKPPPTPAKRGEVSFNFDDADVYSVIQTIFGDILRVNYIVDPTVKGRVTFRSVAPIAREDVLPLMEVILRLNGIAIAEEGGLYRIIPLSDIPREPAPVGIGRKPEAVLKEGTALVQVVPIHYIQSSEMVRVLTPFLSKNAVIVDVPKSNYIIIVDTDANVKRLLQLVEIFDSEQLRQITPKVFVYSVQNSKAKDVASLLEQIFLGAKPKTEQPKTPAVPGRTPPIPGQPPQPVVQQPKVVLGEMAGEAVVSENTKIIPDEVTNSIIVLATPEDYKIISETIELIDILPRQVVIEGLIARVDLIDNLSFGFTWSMKTDIDVKGVLNRDIKLDGDVGSLPTGPPTEGGPISGGLGKGFTFVATDPSGVVRARLEAALLDSKAKILAAPHILVSDNREARIQVGSQIPLATSTTTSIPTTGTETIVTTPVTSSIQYKDIGIILKVKPQVNDSGLVSLEITQEVSSQGDAATIAGQAYTSINKTEATTNLVAQDGETIIIGGLIREDTTKSKDGIPLLSKIPIIGNLFSNVVDNTTRTELIILLTPHVMRTQQEAGEVSSTYIDQFKKTSRDKDIQKFIRERGVKQQEPADGRNGGPDDDKKE
jgi:general secretion pathway protein D